MAFLQSDDELNSNDLKQVDEQRTLLTIVGDYASIDGKFKISQAIEVDCELKGKLTVDGKITIQKNGNVNADIKTREAEIIGKYEGNMEASGYVEIMETGVVVGNIKTDSLIINKGGIFSGTVTRITEQPPASKRKTKPINLESEPEEVSQTEDEEEKERDEFLESQSVEDKETIDSEENLSL